MKLVELKKGKKSDRLVIERLEEALCYAKERPIYNMALVMLSEDGMVLDCWATGKNPTKLIGALDVLKMDVFNSLIEKRSDE